MNTGIYGQSAKGLIQLDPRTKLLIFFAGSVFSLNSYAMLPMLVYGTALCLILALCGKPWLALKSYLGWGAVMYLRWCVMSSPGAPFLEIIVTTLTMLVLFSFPFLLGFLLLVETTRLSQFLAAFQAMHLPVKLIIPVAVFFRFIPTVQEEWIGIRKAMAFRGIALSPAAIIRQPLKTIEYILIPLLLSSIAVMEELAAATLARGMDLDIRRSSYEQVKLKALDYLVMAFFIGLSAYLLASGKGLT